MIEAGSASYIHATAFVVGERGILITGPSGAGKSRLAALLLGEAARRGLFARLVGDDRVALVSHGGRLVASGHPATAGLIERRTEGLVAMPCERSCVIDRLVELSLNDPPRLPEPASGWADVFGVSVRRATVPAGLTGFDAADLLDRLLLPVRATT